MNLTPHIKHVILALIIAASILLLTWKIAAHNEAVDHDQVVLDKAKVDADVEKAKLQANQTAQANADLKNQMAALVASNNKLRADVATLQTTLANQKKQNDSATPSQLADRWCVLIALNGCNFTSTESNITAPLPEAHATVNALEEVPALRQENKLLTDNSAEKDKTISKQQLSLSSTQSELDTCKVTIQDKDNLCKKQISELKAKAVKRNVVLSVISFISGIIFKTKVL